MGKIHSFTTWLELQTAQAQDPDKTHIYVPSAQSQVSTGNGASDQTVDYNPGMNSTAPDGRSGMGRHPIDPDIAQSAQSLQGIHKQLRDIFVKAREKAQAFRYPKMKAAFDRELISGIDGVGRAHAIILPTAQGI